jgi:hypothetical protein
MGIHFLRCVHGNEHTKTHDVVRDTFVAIVQDVGFHVGEEQLHVLPSTTFNSSCQWVNIVFTKNDIHTLIDVVIVDPMWVNLFPWSCATQRFVTFDAAQVKEKSYYNWHLTNQFLPLTIGIFGCLHKHAHVFSHDYANAIWNLKKLKGFHLSILVIFLCKKISITLERMQSSSILGSAIVVCLTMSQLPSLWDTPPITMANLLQVIEFWHGEILTSSLSYLDIL